MKITYNALKRNKVGRWVWRDTGKWASKSNIRQFRALRSKVAKKRERKFREFKAKFKFHRTISKNVDFITHCISYRKGKGIDDLARLYRRTRLKEDDHTRFHIGSWVGSCFDKRRKCPKRKFIAHVKLDKYKLPREQPTLTKDNFVELFKRYIDEVFPIMIALYLAEVCPACPSGEVIIDIKTVCFQIVRVR